MLLFCFTRTGIESPHLMPNNDDDLKAVVDSVLRNLPKVYDIEKVRKTFPINITPPGMVLIQELDRFNLLLGRVEGDLIDLQRVTRDGPKRMRKLLISRHSHPITDDNLWTAVDGRAGAGA